ncbi:MAG: nuclease [Acidobacteria bacterium]|nr:nuclease [Acidobacteriota bacterium]
MGILADTTREFVATKFLLLEVLAIPTKYRLTRELNFYNRFFNNVAIWVDEASLIQPALTLACQYGIGGMDALHLAAAIAAKADFISAEKPTKPFYQAYSHTFSIY